MRSRRRATSAPSRLARRDPPTKTLTTRRRERSLVPPTRRPDPPHAQASAAARPRQALLGPREPLLLGLAPPPRRRPTRDRDPLASAGMAPLLVVALSVPGRPPAPELG